MKSHLRYTCEDYVQEADSRGVRPISHIDGQIITRILGHIKDEKLHEILDQWKHISDEDVLKAITDYTQGNVVEISQNTEEFDDDTFTFVEIQNHTLIVEYFRSIAKFDGYKGDQKYWSMIINQSSAPSPLHYQDLEISYRSQISRDRDYQRLIQLIKKRNNYIKL